MSEREYLQARLDSFDASIKRLLRDSAEAVKQSVKDHNEKIIQRLNKEAEFIKKELGE